MCRLNEAKPLNAIQRGYVPWKSSGGIPDSQSPTVGLIAGWGRFPVLVAEALVRSNYQVACIALKGLADPALEYICDDVRWMGIGKLGGHIRYFRKHGVCGVTMAGKLFKADLLFNKSLFLSLWPDLQCVRTFAPHFILRSQDTRDDTLLTAVTTAYQRSGIQVNPATDYAPELLVGEGILTRKSPSAGQLQDIEFGWTIAKQMGGLDIGQSITVRDRTVIAVEAVEGTDACIDRSGQLCKRGGWTLVKVAKPNQDMRFDVPTIGPQTVERVHHAGGRAIAIEAGKTIVVDLEETRRKAEKLGIAIIAVQDGAAVQQRIVA